MSTRTNDAYDAWTLCPVYPSRAHAYARMSVMPDKASIRPSVIAGSASERAGGVVKSLRTRSVGTRVPLTRRFFSSTAEFRPARRGNRLAAGRGLNINCEISIGCGFDDQLRQGFLGLRASISWFLSYYKMLLPESAALARFWGKRAERHAGRCQCACRRGTRNAAHLARATLRLIILKNPTGARRPITDQREVGL